MHTGECCAQIDLFHNEIGGYFDEQHQSTIYTPDGFNAIDCAIRTSASLTTVNLGLNKFDTNAKEELRYAVRDRAGFQLDL